MDGPKPKPPPVLMVDDDADDRLMTERVLRDQRLVEDVRFVEDGQALMDYLRHEGPYADPATSPRPGLILLDLNMPRKDGREALNEIKADRRLRDIPIVVLTNSRADEDVARSYDSGVNSFVAKPTSFRELTEALRVIGQYWFTVVCLPPTTEDSPHDDSHTPVPDR